MVSRIKTLTAATIRERLDATAAPSDPLNVAAGDADWRAALLETFGDDLVPSAVLVPIITRASGLTVLLTERSADLTHHPGQISFPGGRAEEEDADLVETALRETEEEVGIPRHSVEIAGFLPPLPTVTGYAVTPVVGLVDAGVTLTLDEREVATAFEVPLGFLLDPRNRTRTTRAWQGVDIPVIAYHYEERRIWGATAAMIVSLQDILIGNRSL